MIQSVNINSKKIVEILKHQYPNASEFLLFGSYARNNQRSNSDIDILIRFDKNEEQELILKSAIQLPDYIDVFIQCGMKVVSLRKKIELDESESIISYQSQKMWDKSSNIIYSDMNFYINDIMSVKTTG